MDLSNFDFGFTAVDEPLTATETHQVSAPQTSDEVLQKLYEIENRLLSLDNSTLLQEHRNLIEQDVAEKLKQAEDLILPLLYNLKKNPEKEYIHWPNRLAVIDKQIEKILAVTRFYDRTQND